MDEGRGLNLAHIARQARGEAPEGGAPGLLLLHGRGADEADLMGLEPALDPRLTIVSARAPLRFGLGFAWYNLTQTGASDDASLRASLEELRKFTTALPSAYGIDPQRLYAMGFSQGAVMAGALALTEPEMIKGVVIHSGYTPTRSGLDFQADGIEGKGFFVAHGLYDDVIPASLGRATQAFLSAQRARVTYREYPIGHSISEESLYELSEWLSLEIES